MLTDEAWNGRPEKGDPIYTLGSSAVLLDSPKWAFTPSRGRNLQGEGVWERGVEKVGVGGAG